MNGDAIDHSPAALAAAKDDEVAAIITTGLANNHPIKIDGVAGHRWEVSEAERDGLVTFLRGLEPRGFK